MSRFFPFVERHFDIFAESGDEVTVRCPFHDDRSPSMRVNVRKGLFFCHACGEKGNIQRLADKLGTTVMDSGVAVTTLKNRLELLRSNNHHEDPNFGKLDESYLDRFAVQHDYWTETRGFTQETIDRFQLGYDVKRNRLSVPLRDSRANLMGIIFRQLGDAKPKYVYPKGFAIGKSLFPSWLVRNQHKKIALVEGPLDAIACWDARVPALALLGSRLSPDQRKLLLSLGLRTVVIMTDNDKAGHRAVDQIIDQLHRSGIRVKVGLYRPYWKAKDPGELKPLNRKKMFHTAMGHREYLQSPASSHTLENGV